MKSLSSPGASAYSSWCVLVPWPPPAILLGTASASGWCFVLHQAPSQEATQPPWAHMGTNPASAGAGEWWFWRRGFMATLAVGNRRFGEEMTWGMQVFLLWLLVDSQGKRGLVMVTCFSQPLCILKYCGVRQNSPKVFLHHNLLGMHQPGATNSSQKSSVSPLLWKVYPWLRTTQIAKWRELMYFYLCWAHFPYRFGNVLSDFSWKQHIR